MNSPTNEPITDSSSSCHSSYDYGNFLAASLFIFMGIGSLVNEEWINAAGWLVLALGLGFLLGAAPVSDENWKKPRYLGCIFLLVVGISLILNAPSHHKKLSSAPTSNPAASAATEKKP